MITGVVSWSSGMIEASAREVPHSISGAAQSSSIFRDLDVVFYVGLCYVERTTTRLQLVLCPTTVCFSGKSGGVPATKVL